ncbi:MAG: serine hydrolase, partial [Telluria sp.]
GNKTPPIFGVMAPLRPLFLRAQTGLQECATSGLLATSFSMRIAEDEVLVFFRDRRRPQSITIDRDGPGRTSTGQRVPDRNKSHRLLRLTILQPHLNTAPSLLQLKTMKIICLASVAIASFCSTGLVNAAAVVSGLRDVEVQSLIRDRVVSDQQNVGIVVGVIDKNGSRIFSHGVIKRAGARAVDGDTVFEIGSLTKLFTSLLLADMVERGEVSLADRRWIRTEGANHAGTRKL